MNLIKTEKSPSRKGKDFFILLEKTGQFKKNRPVFGWGGGISESLRSLDCFRQPKFLRLQLEILGRQVRTRWFLILTENKKQVCSKRTNLFFGWGGGIRTHEMQESKSCALPLGDAPILSYSKNAHSL